MIFGEKQVEVIRDETMELVTTIEPLYPLIIIVVALLLFGGGIILFLMKKCTLISFLKLCSVTLCIVAVVMPWWGLSASATTPSANRLTSAYLTTQTIVTTTTVGTYTEIELANIPEVFSLFLLAVLIMVSITCIIILSSIAIQLSNVGLGGLQGSGTFTVPQPQSNEYMNLSATWGLSTGAYLTIVAIILIVVTIPLERISKKKKNSYKKY